MPFYEGNRLEHILDIYFQLARVRSHVRVAEHTSMSKVVSLDRRDTGNIASAESCSR